MKLQAAVLTLVLLLSQTASAATIAILCEFTAGDGIGTREYNFGQSFVHTPKVETYTIVDASHVMNDGVKLTGKINDNEIHVGNHGSPKEVPRLILSIDRTTGRAEEHVISASEIISRTGVCRKATGKF